MRSLLLTVSLFATPGCFIFATRGDAEKFEKDIREIRAEQSAGRETRERNERALEAQVAELERVTKEANALVVRNSADVGAAVESLQGDLSGLQGRLDELRTELEAVRRDIATSKDELNSRLEDIARRAGLDPPLDPAKIPAQKGDHFAAAHRAYADKQYPTSRSLFRAYLQRYARDEMADDAQYWVGMTYLQEDRPATALGELQKVLDQYPQADIADDAMADMAEAFYKLHACGDAKTLYQSMLQKFPRSPLADRARRRIREIERAPAGQCRS